MLIAGVKKNRTFSCPCSIKGEKLGEEAEKATNVGVRDGSRSLNGSSGSGVLRVGFALAESNTDRIRRCVAACSRQLLNTKWPNLLVSFVDFKVNCLGSEIFDSDWLAQALLGSHWSKAAN